MNRPTMNRPATLGLVFCMLTFTACQTHLANYRPMLADGYRWNEIGEYSATGENRYQTTILRIDGDTTINGKTYRKVMESYTENMEDWQLNALLREDVTNQRVYYLHNGKEFLLYDFGMRVGSKTKLYLCEFYSESRADDFDYTMELTAINTKEDNQKNIYREFVYEVSLQHKDDTDKQVFTHRTMERFGSPYGLISKNMSYILCDCGYSLLCAYNDADVLVWSNDNTEAPYAGYCFYNYNEDKE